MDQDSMNYMPKISFIVPVRDRPCELRVCLASCLIQTYRNWEAVIVDDHSDSDIKSVVEKLEDERFIYVKQKNGMNGVAQARQTAIQMATGNILLTLDSDDINAPHRADRCRILLQEDNAEMIYTRVYFFDHESGRTHVKPVLAAHNPALLEKFNYITNPGTAFTRKAYDAAGGYYDSSLEIGEDYDLYLRMQKAGVTISAIDEQHIYYRKGCGSLTLGAESRMAKAVEEIRNKHLIHPFSFSELKELAPRRLWRSISDNSSMKEIWSDRRYTGERED